jgi:hypothetical protein
MRGDGGTELRSGAIAICCRCFEEIGRCYASSISKLEEGSRREAGGIANTYKVFVEKV